MSTPTAYVLALADDALISSQRLGWWISRAPQLEEDVAMANIGLDQLGQARALLSLAGAATGRSEDDLAYLRNERDFRNVCLVEREQADFGVAMARMLVFSTWQHELYSALSGSSDAMLAAISAKAVKETAYHVDHATHWVLRLGDGTDESHARMQAAVDAEWPWRAELFETEFLDDSLVADGVAVDPSGLQGPVEQRLEAVLHQATLNVPDTTSAYSKGRLGRHTEAMGYLLAEMQHLHRSHPGVNW
ncbi:MULTISPECIES: 1,2-phenylacetyl-CoA epoxidase subunit PaaC [unclassified Nocardioides]|uniref:1,2-phenylacetyl-CoA epoxidase subunit PaaC n=1 Tax=unclassified Nocardioides TaxID=2615069 RepID=UPI0006F4083D|nr:MULTISPECIES: 1,2-phenylacetyl-CoA epoxidase subunit PaaC [unclassified Nocardioides]KQY63886.1 phenylacetic acid degradation protein [Nocardioides sp. Root140]KRF15900.1 phenylacetic acid degradation protein [Nocardioides sp. Soil796]